MTEHRFVGVTEDGRLFGFGFPENARGMRFIKLIVSSKPLARRIYENNQQELGTGLIEGGHFELTWEMIEPARQEELDFDQQTIQETIRHRVGVRDRRVRITIECEACDHINHEPFWTIEGRPHCQLCREDLNVH